MKKTMKMLLAVPLVWGVAACGGDDSGIDTTVSMAPATETVEPMMAEPAPAAQNIVAVAREAGTFNTLLAAADAAGLVPVLQGEGPFTLFAPTDEAFAKLPAGTVEALLADRARLTAILTYHVVPGRVMSGDLTRTGGGTPATVQGETMTIAVEGGSVRVDGATVTAADIQASNGVIHVIDSVILPDAAS